MLLKVELVVELVELIVELIEPLLKGDDDTDDVAASSPDTLGESPNDESEIKRRSSSSAKAGRRGESSKVGANEHDEVRKARREEKGGLIQRELIGNAIRQIKSFKSFKSFKIDIDTAFIM